MTWFIFFGDMLVMLFMAALAVWVLWRSSDETIQRTARIPLQDERFEPDPASGEPPNKPRSPREPLNKSRSPSAPLFADGDGVAAVGGRAAAGRGFRSPCAAGRSHG